MISFYILTQGTFKRDLNWSTLHVPRGGGGLPYKGFMGTCGQPGYVFRDFVLNGVSNLSFFCLNQGIDLSIFVLNRMSFLAR